LATEQILGEALVIEKSTYIEWPELVAMKQIAEEIIMETLVTTVKDEETRASKAYQGT
jgi:hypothetical protein